MRLNQLMKLKEKVDRISNPTEEDLELLKELKYLEKSGVLKGQVHLNESLSLSSGVCSSCGYAVPR